MPPNCWIPTSELDVMQRHARYLEAADRIEHDAATIERLLNVLKANSEWRLEKIRQLMLSREPEEDKVLQALVDEQVEAKRDIVI